MGMFVNTLVIRSKPVGHISFKQFLQQIKSTAIHAYEHQEYPFDRLVEKAGANRDTSRNPVFDVMFNMQQSELNRLELGQWRLSEHSFQYNIAKFDLTLTATEQDGELCFEMEYAADLFKRETVERMSRHYLHVLEQGIHDADKFIAEIELVTETEKHQILLDFNDTLRAYPADKCIHELFDEQAIALMDKIALSSQGYHWTYGELNRISDLLAKWLRKKGIRPEQTVGVVAERSCALVISILAILKAGGVYLPIDPSYPVDRVRYMLDDCEVKLLLVQQKMKSSALIAELLELRGETELVLVGERPLEDWYVEESVDLDESNLIQDSRPESLAYIMYTSGTTGQPKGVMVEHRNVVRLVKNCHYAPLYEGTRILLTGSPSFDAATFEIWGALLNGMQLFIADDDVLMRDDYLAGFLQEHDINLLWLTAPLFRQLADRKPDLFQPLHTLLVGGDVLPIHQVKQVREACPDLIIQNMYGPTENTTFSTYHVVNDSLEAGIPIGKPITNSTAYIMDRYRRLLPIGVVGEICVGGDGLARGYVHRDDLTDSRFVHNPYAPGERMYLTGDLGRWLPDGSIEFLGRRDNQVKIRGYRIEIEEIEQQLRACPDIREAVVTVGENSSGEKQLIAYVVTNESETKPRTEEWRDRLAKALPAYMIPALFCTVDFIPLKANGKMDLSALPSPDHIVSESAYSKDDGASTDIEKKMVELIKRLLSVEHVRMSDQLLLLGGHSLIFINLAIEIEQLFGVSLSIVDVMESRTISDLTAKVVQLHEGDVLQNI
ncbi:Gramicidin S synthase 2 [compost metagenome]